MTGAVRRGEIYYADLSPVVGSEQGGMRPVLIVQNDMGNRHSPTVIAAAITSRTGKARLHHRQAPPAGAGGAVGRDADAQGGHRHRRELWTEQTSKLNRKPRTNCVRGFLRDR